eukprot:CAMPEP_0184325780 /NCGR_PEP_ID=MMETSP1049-20130417/142152_1 /TAXON_ID=77928 /ORGANISM="Proteomonas sulcata, Strain CCMP704" /LENGTH=62 /DNA_ID=CAMNT_0026647933 /DNA_START=104 /DNA_END=292 /DNA_ORIENTATION=+
MTVFSAAAETALVAFFLLAMQMLLSGFVPESRRLACPDARAALNSQGTTKLPQRSKVEAAVF